MGGRGRGDLAPELGMATAIACHIGSSASAPRARRMTTSPFDCHSASTSSSVTSTACLAAGLPSLASVLVPTTVEVSDLVWSPDGFVVAADTLCGCGCTPSTLDDADAATSGNSMGRLRSSHATSNSRLGSFSFSLNTFDAIG
jgi:hypothetical protein